jgi:hypothetical protein
VALNGLERASPPVTLPKFALADINVEREAREAAARVAERSHIFSRD